MGNRFKRTKILLFFTVLLMLAVLLGGCVSTSKYTGVLNQLATVQSDLSSASQSRDAAVQSLTTANQQITSLNDRAATLQNTLTETQSDLSTTQQSLNTITADRDSYKTQLTGAQANIAGLQTTLTKTQSDLTTAQADLTQTQTDLAASQTELENTIATLIQTQSDLAGTQKQLETANANLATSQAELSALQANYTNVTSGYGYVFSDPTYAEMQSFLAADQTDKHPYNTTTYNCFNFSADTIANAAKQYIRCGFVYIEFPDSAHAIIAFNTTDKGIVYIEPQHDDIVLLKVGGHYSQQEIPQPGYYIEQPDFDDTVVSFTVIW